MKDRSIMKCKKIEKNIISYLGKNLSPEKHETIKNHLKSCSNCQALVEKFELYWNDIENPVLVKPNPFFWTRLKQKINEHEAKTSTNVIKNYFTKLRPVFLTITVIGGILLGCWLGNIPIESNGENKQSSVLFNSLR